MSVVTAVLHYILYHNVYCSDLESYLLCVSVTVTLGAGAFGAALIITTALALVLLMCCFETIFPPFFPLSLVNIVQALCMLLRTLLILPTHQ